MTTDCDAMLRMLLFENHTEYLRLDPLSAHKSYCRFVD